MSAPFDVLVLGMKVVDVLIIGAFGHTPDEKHVVDSVLTHVGGPASTGACHNRPHAAVS
jgi:hypothetical protein